MNSDIMRLPMACATVEHVLVLVLMTICTSKVMMFCGGSRQIFPGTLMAAYAQRRGNICSIGNFYRHMGPVTAQAIVIYHLLCMGFMTFHALCRLAVGHVTLFTVQSSMFTRVGFHFLTLIRVAGETRSLHLSHFCKIHLQRIVGIVARCAIIKCIMGTLLRFMAYSTCRDDTFLRRGMLLVTLDAPDLLVGRSPFIYFLYWALMTTRA
jgi:hypothetical protein